MIVNLVANTVCRVSPGTSLMLMISSKITSVQMLTAICYPPPLNPPRLRYSVKQQDLLASFSNRMQGRPAKVGGFRYTSGCIYLIQAITTPQQFFSAQLYCHSLGTAGYYFQRGTFFSQAKKWVGVDTVCQWGTHRRRFVFRPTTEQQRFLNCPPLYHYFFFKKKAYELEKIAFLQPMVHTMIPVLFFY